MMSNADVALVRENFTDDKYTTTSILDAPSIVPTQRRKEVIITN
jgi:hypothetical protein